MAGNSDGDIKGADFTSTGYNIIGNGDTGALIRPSDQTGILDPQLEPLGFHGGFTPGLTLWGMIDGVLDPHRLSMGTSG